MAKALREKNVVFVGATSYSGSLATAMSSVCVETFVPNESFGEPRVCNYLFFRDILDRVRPDIVHLNGLSGSPVLFACAESGIPIVYHLRVQPTIKHKEHLESASAIICISKWIHKEMCRLGISTRKATVVYNAVDGQHLSREIQCGESLREKLGIPDSRLILVQISRISREKRFDISLKALRLLVDSGIDTHLVCVGERFDEQYYAEIIALIRSLNLDSNVSICGFVADIELAHQIADIVLLCSDNEPLGRALMEAMSMGKPVIGTRSGGIPELIRDGLTGLLIRPGDPYALAAAVTRLANDSAYRDQLGDKAKRYAEEQWTPKKHAARILKVYQRVLQRAPILAQKSIADIKPHSQ